MELFSKWRSWVALVIAAACFFLALCCKSVALVERCRLGYTRSYLSGCIQAYSIYSKSVM